MKKIITFTLLLSALIVCGCSKDNENDNNSSENLISPELTFTVNDAMFKMIEVKGGSFTMGATAEQGNEANRDEKPSHKVMLDRYYIGQTEVTQALWEAVMGSNPSEFKGDNLPVENVSWNDCQKFIHKLNQLTGRTFRLPTEAEWEYAARGGSWSHGYKYCGSDKTDDVAWRRGNSDYTTHAVGTKTHNELGLYDMSGNVHEWCQDWYGKYFIFPQTNPTGPTLGTYRVIRGGYWFSYPESCRVSVRESYPPNIGNSSLGFRLALVP